MPAIQDLVKKMTGKEPHKGVNPDEVVAVGAGVQAGVLKGDVKDVLLLDVTPLSLGIETRGGIMTKLIERNTTIPTRRTEVFTTAEDMQPSVEIHVLQGEREMASFNKTLGKFQLVGLPPAPRGIPQIEVTFDIDANGIVHVSAKDRATNKEQSMTITGQSALNKDEINRMIRDADAHAEEDRERREEAETRNQGDTLVYQTERMIREHGERMSEDEKDRLQSAVKNLKSSLKGNDMGAIRSDTEALMTVNQGITTRLYSEAASDGSGRRRRRRRRLRRRGGRRRDRGRGVGPMPDRTEAPQAEETQEPEASASPRPGRPPPPIRRRPRRLTEEELDQEDQRSSPTSRRSCSTTWTGSSPSATTTSTSCCAPAPTSTTTASASRSSRPSTSSGRPRRWSRSSSSPSTPSTWPSPTARGSSRRATCS